MAQMVKNLPAIQDTGVRSLGQEDALGKGMTTHSSKVQALSLLVYIELIHTSLYPFQLSTIHFYQSWKSNTA